ncbi:MAG: hypothetical protein II589_09000 [Clostridia bacterium]|nr:hypothetical protein [Clostridia bacterium]
MKKRVFAASLSLCVLLSGCTVFGKEYTFRDYLGNIPYADEINDAIVGEDQKTADEERPDGVKFPEDIQVTDNTGDTESAGVAENSENTEVEQHFYREHKDHSDYTIDDADQNDMQQAFLDERFRKEYKEYTDGEFSYKEYIYDYNTMGSTKLFIVAANNSNRSVSITAACTAKDSHDRKIGTGEETLDFLGPGETACMCVDFYGVTEVDHVESSFTYIDEKEYKPVFKDLEITCYENKNAESGNNAVAQLKNNGTKLASRIEGYALFFSKDGYLINYEFEYCHDILPGETNYIQFNNYTDFFEGKYDHVDVYFSARTYDIDPSYYNKPTVTNDQFEIKEMEYTYNNFGALLNSKFLLIKNNSNQTVNVQGTGILKNKDGTIAAVSDIYSDGIIGPDEASLCIMNFFEKPDDAVLDYSVRFEKADDYYIPIQKNLSVKSVNLGDNTVEITVKNNGSIPVEFVEGHILFFDANNNIVFDTSVSFYGEEYLLDTSLNPGGSYISTASSRLDFDHYEVYVSGYGVQ